MSDEFEKARQGRRGGAPCDIEPGAEPEPRQNWEPTPGNAIGTEAISRRGFLQGATLLAGGLATVTVNPVATHAQADKLATQPVRMVPLSLSINGQQHAVQVDPRMSLLDLLREQLQLTGTKKGCDHGQCGACTVIAGGRRINSCLSLALVHAGDMVLTIEGLAKGDDLHPVQTAFLENDGYQCGYCTPGQICSAVALLDEVQKGEPSAVTTDLSRTGPVELTTEEIRERMSGNLCRCGAYPGIVAAVEQAYRGRVQQNA